VFCAIDVLLILGKTASWL